VTDTRTPPAGPGAALLRAGRFFRVFPPGPLRDRRTADHPDDDAKEA